MSFVDVYKKAISFKNDKNFLLEKNMAITMLDKIF